MRMMTFGLLRVSEGVFDASGTREELKCLILQSSRLR